MNYSKKSGGYLYSVAFDNGLLKVGKTSSSPNGRIRSHESKALLVGAKKTTSSLTSIAQFMSEAERELIIYCKGLMESAPLFGSEWFYCSSEDVKLVEDKILYLSRLCDGLSHGCPTADDATRDDRLMAALGTIAKPPVFSCQNEWSDAVGVAKLAQQIIQNNMIWSDIFDPSEIFFGYSHFVGIFTAYLVSNKQNDWPFILEKITDDLNCSIDANDLGLFFSKFEEIEDKVSALPLSVQGAAYNFFSGNTSPILHKGFN